MQIVTIMILIFFSTFKVLANEQRGCNTGQMKVASDQLTSEGYIVKKIFDTHVLMHTYGSSHYHKNLPAYQFQNSTGDVQFVTCRGLYKSPYQTASYTVKNGPCAGGVIEVQAQMNAFFSISPIIKSNLKNHCIEPRVGGNQQVSIMKPETKTDLFKFNANGELYGIDMLGKSGSYSIAKILDANCYKPSLPFNKIVIKSKEFTGSNYASVRSKAKIDFKRVFLQQDNLCQNSHGITGGCYKSSGMYNTVVECDNKGLENPGPDNSYNPKIHCTQTHDRNNSGYWSSVCEATITCSPRTLLPSEIRNQCTLLSIIESRTSLEKLNVVIKGNISDSDIEVPKELIIPSEGASLTIINESPFYINFEGAASPFFGTFYPVNSIGAEPIKFKVMPGNYLKLSPYPGKIHWLRFKGHQ